MDSVSSTTITASSDTFNVPSDTDSSISSISVVKNDSVEENAKDANIDVPEEYASCGIISDPKTGRWEYQGKQIAVLYDKDKYVMTNGIPEKNAVYLEVRRNKIGGIEEFKELYKDPAAKPPVLPPYILSQKHDMIPVSAENSN